MKNGITDRNAASWREKQEEEEDEQRDGDPDQRDKGVDGSTLNIQTQQPLCKHLNLFYQDEETEDAEVQVVKILILKICRNYI